MRGCVSSGDVAFPFNVVLCVSLLGCGEQCIGLKDQGIFGDRFSAARTPSQDKALGLPAVLGGCVRLNWSSEHRMTPFAFITIGLQCLLHLRDNKQIILQSIEQIQFLKSSTQIHVKIDPDDSKYKQGYVNRAGRGCLMEQVLSHLATSVSSPFENDPQFPVAVTALWKRYASRATEGARTKGTLTEGMNPFEEEPADGPSHFYDSNILEESKTLEEPKTPEQSKTLEAMEMEFREAYMAWDPQATLYPKATLHSQDGWKHWRGVCRPRLGLNARHQVAVKEAGGSGSACSDCQPRIKVNLKTPFRTRAIAASTASACSVAESDGTENGRTWPEVVEAAAVQVMADAHARNLRTMTARLYQTWKPWKLSYESDDLLIKHQLGRYLRNGCIIRLHDLLTMHRLTHSTTDSLVRQLRRRLSHISNRVCVSSYAQVYVILERRGPRFSSTQLVPETKLRIILTPECILARSEKEATQITNQFIETFKADAGCPSQ